MLKMSMMLCTDYSCELNDSRSESDEVNTGTGTAHVHYFINNLVEFKCLWKGAAQPQLKFLWRGLGCSCCTCRRSSLTCRRMRVLGGGESNLGLLNHVASVCYRLISWGFLHKG